MYDKLRMCKQASLYAINEKAEKLLTRVLNFKLRGQSDMSDFNGKFLALSHNLLEYIGKELAQLEKDIKANRYVDDKIIDLIKQFPKNAHPMGVLRTLCSTLGVFDPKADLTEVENKKRVALRLTSAFPTLIAAYHRIKNNEKPVTPNDKLSHAANFLYMMHDRVPEDEMAKALDAYLILLADHSLNASTFSARVTISSQSDMYSAITAAIGTLKGDLHGCANQRAMEMILDIGEKTADKFIETINKSKIVIWNGPLGKTEIPEFSYGSERIAMDIVNPNIFSLVGGGDTIAFLEKNRLLDKFSYVSTGGGAMLEFLAGKTLPGLAALGYK